MNDIWSLYNEFWLHADVDRVRKIIQRYELFRMSIDVPGDILECGIMKGVGLCQWMKFRDTHSLKNKHVYGFDIDGFFGDQLLVGEETAAEDYLTECRVSENFSFSNLETELLNKGFENFSFVLGDIITNAPKVAGQKITSISLINIDVDSYMATKAILDAFWPFVSKGGIIIFDEYHSEEWGERQAVDEWSALAGEEIQHLRCGDQIVAYVKKS